MSFLPKHDCPAASTPGHEAHEWTGGTLSVMPTFQCTGYDELLYDFETTEAEGYGPDACDAPRVGE